eukprot:gene9912-2234_t
MKIPPREILDIFGNLTDYKYETVKNFVLTYFDEPGSELMQYEPLDWKEKPKFIDTIESVEFKILSSNINGIWKQLVRKFNHEKYCKECYSSIDIQHPFMIPGNSRDLNLIFFKKEVVLESFIIGILIGLLISEMYNTAYGHIMNLLDMLKRFKFVPNGGRIYYLNRSQPPLLTLMVSRFYEETKNETFLKEALPLLDSEYKFWMEKRYSKKYNLNLYNASTTYPRPESFDEDVKTAEESTQTPQQIFSNIASGAETGWDFSSRWFENGKDLSTIVTTEILPVDLNSILYKNEKILSELHSKFGNLTEYYKKQSEIRLEAMNKYLFKDYQWCDFNYVTEKLNENLYSSNFSPLWAGAHKEFSDEEITKILEKMDPLTVYPAGIPTSLIHTGEQWDFPNSWAPTEMFIIEGLAKLNSSKSHEIAYETAREWISTVYCAWISSEHIFEKYNVTRRGFNGGGGEYEIQTGFGWTNGAVLMILKLYGDTIRPMKCNVIYTPLDYLIFLSISFLQK